MSSSSGFCPNCGKKLYFWQVPFIGSMGFECHHCHKVIIKERPLRVIKICYILSLIFSLSVVQKIPLSFILFIILLLFIVALHLLWLSYIVRKDVYKVVPSLRKPNTKIESTDADSGDSAI